MKFNIKMKERECIFVCGSESTFDEISYNYENGLFAFFFGKRISPLAF